MNDQYAALMAQMPYFWHQDGLLVGMHWTWMILVVGMVLIGAFWIASARGGMTHRQEAPAESAEEALRRRFAQGEIGEEQFAETLRVLRESR
jgi:uncharacterized membrane protein